MLCWLLAFLGGPAAGVLSFSWMPSVSSSSRSSSFSPSLIRPVLAATTSSSSLLEGETTKTQDVDPFFNEELVRSLDLDLVLEQVAAHAGTRRGRQAFLASVGQQDDDADETAKKNPFWVPRGQKQQQQRWIGGTYNQQQTASGKRRRRRREPVHLEIATSALQAQQAYELTELASRVLEESSKINGDDSSNMTVTTLLPPLYGADSSPWDTQTVALTDYDDWIEFSSSTDYYDDEYWTLEHVAQAEQVIGTLLQLVEWAQSDAIQQVAPGLAKQILVGANTTTGSSLDSRSHASSALELPNVAILQNIYAEIKNSVQLVRVRSLTDPTGKGTFSFQLSETKYRVLEILRERQGELQEKMEPSNRQRTEDGQLMALREEIQAKELEIKFGLVRAISTHLDVIDKGLVAMARLDVIFAKAAFGIRFNGQIPLIGTDCTISVNQFVHPLLFLQNTTTNRESVPIDLQLGDTGHDTGKNALVISGPNGGGKSLALKSFGLVSIFCKLGIPIPSLQRPQAASPRVAATAAVSSRTRPRVDLFDHILVSIGDGQDLMHGESTFTAQVNKYSEIIRQVGVASAKSNLVLVDELGSGTDANEGGIIAQAVLEKLLGTESSCRIVATTHSARLKALAFENDDYECAAVLLKPTAKGDRYQRPSYQLQYGCIGESYAFGAAARSNPPLPADVLSRAWELLDEQKSSEQATDKPDEQRHSYNQALAQSLQKQLDLAMEYRIQADKHAGDMNRVRKGMLALASAYDQHLARLELRVDQCYQDMRQSEDKDSIELLGDTLAELRVAQKEIRSEKELLREQGLRLIPDDMMLVQGDSVVIIAKGEWEGTTAEVVSFDSNQQNVAVVPSFGAWDIAVEDSQKPMVLKRYDLAVWDYESAWNDDAINEEQAGSVKSVNESKRRLNKILSTIKSSETKTRTEKVRKVDGSGGNRFKSARERKASRNSKRKRK